MFEVWLWIPTKGWKFIRRHRSVTEALVEARSLTPLEVKVTTPAGESWYGGRVHAAVECETLDGKPFGLDALEKRVIMIRPEEV